MMAKSSGIRRRPVYNPSMRLPPVLPSLVAVTALAASAAFHAASPQPQAPAPLEQRLVRLPTPAAAGSGEPQLTVSSRGTLLSWIEQQDKTASLKFAERTPSGWTAAKTVASGTDWFVNWADVPSVLRLADGTLAAHWLQKSGAGTYAYDVRLSRSSDDGRTWTPSVTPHSDGTQTEHGFASLLQMPGAGLGLVWLDGRETPGPGRIITHHEGVMTLRFGAFNRQWQQTQEFLVDERVCDCCPTAAAITSDGPIVAYRDRSGDEIRDISVRRMVGGKWTAPTPVHRDNWKIAACPVNGPAIAARGRDVVVAWFSAVGDRPAAYVAFSKDAGQTFGAPQRLDGGVTLGRVDVELLADGSALAGYIEQVDQRSQFRIRRVRGNGTADAPITVAGLESGRASGYPRIAVNGGEVTAAWVERDGLRRVQTASLTVR
jgi:hypothetical protein